MQPRYEHEKERRMFLGQFGRFDLYLYAAWTGTTCEAVSLFGVKQGIDGSPELVEAQQRARASGFYGDFKGCRGLR